MEKKKILEFQNISKSFVGVKALSDVSFSVREGEVHALLGENGAGKSTLMKILSGAYMKDAGKVFLDGQEIQVKNTKESERLGISIIYQELNLIPELSVAENIFLDRQPKRNGFIDWKQMNQDAKNLGGDRHEDSAENDCFHIKCSTAADGGDCESGLPGRTSGHHG